MKLPKLYKRAKTGAVLEWTIEAKDGATRTIHGQVDGNLITSKWYTSKATNVGKKNERQPQAQAEFEAQAQWKKREEKNYFTDISEIDNLVYQEPMRAKKWEDENKGKKSVPFPVFVQPKLDGMRAVITKDGATSRGNKPWNTVPHILEALIPVFKKYPNLMLDGELYCDKYAKDFNEISKLIKRKSISEEQFAAAKEHVRFHLYDVCDEDSNFSDRSSFIAELMREFADELKDAVIMVKTYVARSEEELRDRYGKFIEQSYEGAIVRQDLPYEFARSKSVLKMKEFIDEEFKIIDIVEGQGNKDGLAVKCILEFRDGRNFPSTIQGAFPFLKEIWENKEDYIGKYATCKYFELTPVKEDGTGGIPKFSNCDRFRNAPSSDD